VPKNIAAAAVMAINGLGLYSFLGLYETFLRSAHQMELAWASAIFSLFGIGSIVGGFPAGYVADRIGRKLYLLLALIGSAIFGVAAFLARATPWLEGTLCFVFGLGVNSIYTNCYVLIQDQVEKKDIPLGTGVLATIYFLMGSISPTGRAVSDGMDFLKRHAPQLSDKSFRREAGLLLTQTIHRLPLNRPIFD
jgi:MFS family permease